MHFQSPGLSMTRTQGKSFLLGIATQRNFKLLYCLSTIVTGWYHLIPFYIDNIAFQYIKEGRMIQHISFALSGCINFYWKEVWKITYYFAWIASPQSERKLSFRAYRRFLGEINPLHFIPSFKGKKGKISRKYLVLYLYSNNNVSVWNIFSRITLQTSHLMLK